tara:strand:- start:372 stop:479 length:108 start_codon:yes stop_codon:yes gene_type:complete
MEEVTALVVVLEDAEEEEIQEVKNNGLLWSRLLRR